jgi:hypothetical protein
VLGLRCGYAFLDISLPGFVVPNPAFGLFPCKFHFLGYVIDPGSSIFLFIKSVARRPAAAPFRRFFASGFYLPAYFAATR